MNQHNPYAAATTAAFAESGERAAFLKKVYSLLFLGILGFATTLWAAANVPVVHDLAMGIGRVIYGSRFGILLYMGVFLGGSWAVHAVAETKPINAIAYGLWVVVLGLLVAPIVLIVSSLHGPAIISQASLLTAVTFVGLTAAVFWTGSDFSFLRGVLGLASGLLIAVFLAGWLFGFTVGLWGSAAVVALFAGYILYDTGAVIHRLPVSMPMTGAIMLFTDVALLFKNILLLLSRTRD